MMTRNPFPYENEENKVLVFNAETYEEIKSITVIGNDGHIDFSPDGK